MAQAFPNSRFTGFDYHDKSIDRAREAVSGDCDHVPSSHEQVELRVAVLGVIPDVPHGVREEDGDFLDVLGPLRVGVGAGVGGVGPGEVT